MKLKDKVVLITGASSGIGQAAAIKFAEEGAKVVINYRSNKKGAEETLKAVKKNSEGLIVQADVSKLSDVEHLFKTVIDKYSAVDILINNATTSNDKPLFIEESYDHIQGMVNNYLVSVLICSQAAAKIMLKQGHGKILNTSSVRGWQFGGRAAVYAACKGAVNSFTSTLAKQLAPNIQVNAVAPGFTKTRTYDTFPDELVEKFMEQTYLKRFVTSEEIADAFVFLAKNDAITGQIIYVDAGFMLK